MPLYEYMCPNGHYTETICSIDEMQPTITCPECGEPSKRAFTASGAYCGNADDTTWSRETAEVLNSRSTDPIVQLARRDPTKRNVSMAMDKLGVRYLERGERAPRRETAAERRERTKPAFMREWKKATRIEVR